MEQTIAEIRARTGIAERTIRSAASNGPLKTVARQSGRTWLINVASQAYKLWEKRPELPRGKGRPRASKRVCKPVKNSPKTP